MGASGGRQAQREGLWGSLAKAKTMRCESEKTMRSGAFRALGSGEDYPCFQANSGIVGNNVLEKNFDAEGEQN